MEYRREWALHGILTLSRGHLGVPVYLVIDGLKCWPAIDVLRLWCVLVAFSLLR